jgi:DNA-binding LacI/PurR family transcriptional regulator
MVDGVVLSPWALSPADLADRTGRAPLVLLGEQEPGGVADHVAVDSVAAARDATRHLIGLGRRRIAAVGPQPHLDNGTAARRIEGYRQALAEAGLPHDPALEVPVRRLHRADGAEAARRLLDAGPDALFCFSDQLALGAMHVLAERGLRVPEDVAVAGFDDIEDGRYANPPLTTVAPDKAAIARAALDCLADRLAREPYTGPARRITVGHRLEVRRSTG